MNMKTEGNISKVAICNNCNGYVLACHVEYLDRATEKEFTSFTNEGFVVKLETAEETRARTLATYTDCKNGTCK